MGQSKTLAETVLEYEVRFMANVFHLVDTQLVSLNNVIDKDCHNEGDSDLFGDAEYFYGLGFVAGQRYLTSTCASFTMDRKRNDKALALGPRIEIAAKKNIVSYATIVNAAANYWKHSDEWDFDNLTKQQKRTIHTIEKVGIKVSKLEIVAGNVFLKIGLKKFSDLIPILTTWSNAVEADI